MEKEFKREVIDELADSTDVSKAGDFLKNVKELDKSGICGP